MKPKLVNLFQLILVIIMLQSNVKATLINNTSSGIMFEIFNAFGYFLNYVVQNALSMTVIAFLIMLYFWIMRDEGILVLPFEAVNNEKNYNGKAISDLLIAELLRIKQISDSKFSGIENEKIPAQSFEGDSTEIPQLGTVGIGSASFSIGELIIIIKKIIRGNNYRQVINGSIDYSGSNIKLVANCLRKDKSFTWSVQSQNNEDFESASKDAKEYGFISDLVKDLAYRIAYDLSREGISAKTMSGFKYYTEALYNYQEYNLTRQTEFLKLASNNCIKAKDIESNYEKLVNLFYNLGTAYYNIKNYSESEKMFRKSLELGNMFAWYGIGTALGQQGKYDESNKAFDEAMKLDVIMKLDPTWEFFKKENSNNWNNKGLSLVRSGKIDEGIRALDKAIELNPYNAYAWNNKGEALRKEGKNDEALQLISKSIDLDSSNSYAWHNKGETLKLLGRIAEADEALSKAKELGYTE